MSEPLTLGGSLDLLLPITALLPLTAVLLVSQSNPYQTLVLRGILGSVATLLYALLGAPDVAITEALVGTLLSTTLYAVALRSSMALRLEDRRSRRDPQPENRLSQWISPLHLRLRLHDAAADSAAADSAAADSAAVDSAAEALAALAAEAAEVSEEAALRGDGRKTADI